MSKELIKRLEKNINAEYKKAESLPLAMDDDDDEEEVWSKDTPKTILERINNFKLIERLDALQQRVLDTLKKK